MFVNNPTPLPAPALTLEDEFSDPTIHSVLTQGIWAIWYHPDFTTEEQAQITADHLTNTRTVAVTEVGMPEPLAPGDGYYVNVYIHNLPDPNIPDKPEDGFPNWWGNGVGTNAFGYPNIGFPAIASQFAPNVAHEGFHIFQHAANSPGFEYAGDSGWYIETTAEWFSRIADPDHLELYQTNGAIAGNPHLALWHGFDNARPEDPIHWMLEARQYGLHSLLVYLDDIGVADGADITDGFYAGTDLLPQEYLVSRIGKETFANSWADYAALMTASFASDAPMPLWIMSEAQRDFAVTARAGIVQGDPIAGIENDIAFSLGLTDAPFVGTFAPPLALQPRPWAYSVVDLGMPEGDLTVDLLTEFETSFEMRLALLADGADQWTFTEITSGQTQNLDEMDQAYLIVATTPDNYAGSEALPYGVHITLGDMPAPPPDTTPPELLLLSIPDQLDFADGAVTAQITAALSDDISGPGNVVIYFDKPLLYSGDNGQMANDYHFMGIFGAQHDWDQLHATERYDVFATNDLGTYAVTEVQVTDEAGNLRSYSPTELEALGVNTEIEVVNTGAYAVVSDPDGFRVAEGRTLTAELDLFGPVQGPINVTAEIDFSAGTAGPDDFDVFFIGGTMFPSPDNDFDRKRLLTFEIPEDALDEGEETFVLEVKLEGATFANTSTTLRIDAVVYDNADPVGTPTIVDDNGGDLVEGDFVSVNLSGFYDPDGVKSSTHVWFRDGAEIPNENNNFYLLTSEDIGAQITARFDYVDGRGTPETVDATGIGPVLERPNSPPGGTYAIVDQNGGELEVGDTVAVDLSGFSEPDGIVGLIDYTWFRDGVEIPNQTLSFYQLTFEDLGALISARFSYTDGLGTLEVVEVAAIGPLLPPPNAPPVGTPVLVDNNGGALEDGDFVSVDLSGFSDPDGISTINYTWFRNGVEIQGETGANYHVRLTDFAGQISARIDYTDNGGTAESVDIAAIGPVLLAPNNAPFGLPTLNNTSGEGLAVGDLLVFDTSELVDLDALGPLSYAWFRDGVEIPGETGGGYLLRAEDAGKEISGQVSYFDGRGFHEVIPVPALGVVETTNTGPEGAITLFGAPTEGELLSALTGALSDAQGFGPDGFAYQWLRDGSPISGATDINYRLTHDDVAAIISVQVSYTDGAGNPESLTSSGTDQVAALPNNPPTGLPTLTSNGGAALQIGDVLSVDTSNLVDLDTLGPLSYAWFRDGVEISGETGGSYLLRAADAGTQISARVSYTDGRGFAEVIPVSAIGAVDTPNTGPIGVVTISGDVVEGQLLTAQTGDFIDEQGIGPAGLSFEWLRDGVPIAGATGPSYRLTGDDVSAGISVRVSYTDGAGNPENLESTPTGQVAALPNNPPFGLPMLTTNGGAVPNVGDVLSIDTSNLVDLDTLGPLSYAWFRDGVEIQGETGGSYLLRGTDIGAEISGRVSYTDGGGFDEVIPVPTLGQVAGHSNTPPSGQVTISGVASEGLFLTLQTSGLQDADGLGPLSFAWLRDGQTIPNATANVYQLTSADAGAGISAVVSYVDGGGTLEEIQVGPTEPVGGRITGTPNMDVLAGFDGADVIRALDGDDEVTPGKGTDDVDGGGGIDTVSVSGPQTSYTLSLSANSTLLNDRRDDGNGLNILTDVELVDFDVDLFDGPFDLRAFGGATTLGEEAMQSFVELYIAYFNRAPDAVGLNFWGTAFANGLTLEEMASLFIAQDETQLTYPASTSNDDFARAVYDNVLGRAPDIAGINFWVGLLDSNAVARDQFILEVLRGAKADPAPGADQQFIDQQLADRAYLADKVDLGTYFAVILGMSDVGNASAAMDLFTGSLESLSAAKAQTDQFHIAAMHADSGEFLMPLIGVLNDPFAI